MQLNTIQRIETYIVDALIASPLIPLNVNVLRLADAIEKEGVVQSTNNIVVRYTGSTDSVMNRVPLVYTRQMSFECNFSTQNYLSSSGHDFATQLLAGAFLTLNGGVPGNAGVEVLESFTCQTERFTGLSDNSQYCYTQEYVLTTQATLPYVALDPCVARGNCSQLFPGLGVETRLPLGGVVDEATGDIYVPSYPCDRKPDEDYDKCFGIRWSDELTQSGDWVFVCDPECVFIEDPLNQPIYLLSNNSYTPDGHLVVTIWDSVTKQPIREVLYCSTKKKLARYALELWNKSISGDRKQLDATFFSGMKTGDFAVVTGGVQNLYTDPLNPEAPKRPIDGGTLVGVMTETFIQTSSGRFYFVGQSPQGRGWLLEDTFEFASVNSLWRLGCLPCSGSGVGPGGGGPGVGIC